MIPLHRTELAAINQKIADRSNVFYWQTDRAITPAEAGRIWIDRHGYFTDEDIKTAANKTLDGGQLVSVVPFDPAAQTNLGNINSVRIGKLSSGKAVVIRCHPRGIKNGYFHVESLAAQKALDAGLPAYRTFAIHDLEDEEDFAFQICQKLPGDTVKTWLSKHPEDEAQLVKDMGVRMAELHQISVTGFGPFNNDQAKMGKLVGMHKNFGQAVRAGLDFNLGVLAERNILTKQQARAIDKLMAAGNPLLNCEKPVLIHNDFADWNVMTDGTRVTGMIDWDECVAGDPVMDIACWSTFFEPERLGGMLAGYWSVAAKPDDFEEKFQLLRLRYTVSKMTLRVRRYEWTQTDDVKQRIEIGKKHLAVSLAYFGIS